jgi:hypothetical protein
MMIVVLTLLVVMSAPTAMAERNETIVANYVYPNIVVTTTDFMQPEHWYQVRCYQPDTCDESNLDIGEYPVNLTGYLTSDAWVPNNQTTPNTHTCNIGVSGFPDGTWTAYLFKDGIGTSPPEVINSTVIPVTVDVPIPEFATIAIPAIALLGLFAFYRRKQKK